MSPKTTVTSLKGLEVSVEGSDQYLGKSLLTIEIKDSPKPALVAEALAIYIVK